MLVVPTELRPSPLHGVGVFLLAPVKKGELIWRFDSRVDCVYTESELESLPELAREFIRMHAPWDKKTGLYMLCGDNAKYTNHMEHNPTGTGPGDCFGDTVAARDIAAGEEFTENYFLWDNDPHLRERLQPAKGKP